VRESDAGDTLWIGVCTGATKLLEVKQAFNVFQSVEVRTRDSVGRPYVMVCHYLEAASGSADTRDLALRSRNHGVPGLFDQNDL
jgi:hypothetical protein